LISSLEIAKLCGVSQGTVDRALHDRGGVSAATKERVLAVAVEHGYRPNPAAREMLSGKSSVIGALVPSINVVFFMDFLHAIKLACGEFGLRLFITPVGSRDEFLDALGDFAARRVSGVVAVPPDEGIVIPQAIAKALPVATLLSPVANESMPLFAPDEVRTGRDAVAYLAAKGHRRIMHVTYRRDAAAIRDRRDGYVAAMEERGLAPRVAVSVEPDDLTAAISDYDPTALFCHNDVLALKALRVLAQEGIDVPRDISVLGADDSATFNEFDSHITTLAYPFAEVALKAVRWLATKEDLRPISPMRVVERQTVRSL
jgi:LacI family transcriptional regulator